MAVSGTTSGSGLDVEAIVSQLMTLEKRPLTLIDKQIAAKTATAEYFTTFKSKATTFEASLAALRDATLFAGSKATSSDTSAVTATAVTGAAVGDIDVRVQKTATATRLSFVATGATDPGLGGGTLSFTTGADASKNLSITTTAGETLASIASRINSATDSNYKASVVKTGTTSWSLVIEGAKTGAANSVASTFAPTAGGASTTPTPFQAARDAMLSVNGVDITSASNTIDGVVSGVVFQLRKPVDLALASSAASVMVSVDKETVNIQALASNIVSSFNDLQEFYTALTKSSTDPTQRGPLSGNTSFTGLMNTARSKLAQGMTDPTGTTTTFRFADMGIELTSAGKLTLNQTNFSAAMTNGLAARLAAGVTIPLNTYLKQMVLPSGDLGLQERGIVDSQAALQKRRNEIVDRLASVETSLRSRYASLDSTLYKLNNINTSLKSALDGIANSNKNN